MPAETATFDIVHKGANVDDTLRLIVNAVNTCSTSSTFVHKAVELLGPVTDKVTFIKKLFDYVCRNGKYRLDIPEHEEVWTPELTIREGIYDCKKCSVLLASVLKAAGIEPVLKHVYYKGTDGNLKDFTHIYVIVPNPDLQNYITVDPTNDCKWNTEVDSSKQTLYFLNGKKMDLHMMGKAPGETTPTAPATRPANSFTSQVNSLACQVEDEMRTITKCPSDFSRVCGPADYRVDMIGLKAKDGDTVLFEYTAGEAVAHAAAIAALSIPRNAFLGLMYLGKLLAKTPLKLHLAQRFAVGWQRNPSKMRKWWWKNGGTKEATALKKAIIAGSGITISAPYGQGYDYPGLYRDGREGINGPSIGEPVTLATAGAALAAAAPLIIGGKALLKELGVFKEGDEDAAPPDTATPPLVPPPPPILPPRTPTSSTIPNIPIPKKDASFATGTIDNWNDLVNFSKAAGVMCFGTAYCSGSFLLTNSVLAIAFVYALRHQIKNQFYKFHTQ